MTFDQLLVEKKLRELGAYAEEIKEIFKKSDREILSDKDKFRHAERSLQLSVDTMIDINQHFIKELSLKISDDLQGTFIILGENKILPEVFAEKIAPVVGLRNRIVHRDETLNKKLFLTSFRKNFQDFDAYMKHVYAYLERKKNSSR